MFGYRFWRLSVFYTLGAALLIGLPTVLIPNIFFRRMTPTSPQDYIIWVISAALIGAVMALATLYPVRSTIGDSKHSGVGRRRAWAATVLTFFSVGCPICNKLVLLLLGVGGALTIFDPLRPFLGIASIVLLGVTLFLRIRVLRSGCAVRFNDAVTTAK